MPKRVPLTIFAFFLASCAGRPTALPAYHGLTRAQAIAKLGTPDRTDKYPMSRAAGEFRVGLQNTYPLDNPANAAVQIEELTWKDGSHRITLWLHQVNGDWIVLDSCRYHKDIQF